MQLNCNNLLFGFLFLLGAVTVQAQTQSTPSSEPPVKKKPVTFLLSTPAASLKTGELGTFPIIANGTEPLIGWQMGLRFNTDMLEFIGVSVGDLEGVRPESFGLIKVNQGELRALWVARVNDPEDHLRQGQHLFYITFRAKKAVADFSSLIAIDHNVLFSEGYENGGKQPVRFSLKGAGSAVNATSATTGTNLQVTCKPNPATDYFNLDFELKTAGEFRLTVFDAFGRQIYFKSLNLEAGAQTLKITEISQWAAGVYHWDLKGDANAKAEGHVVKQ